MATLPSIDHADRQKQIAENKRMNVEEIKRVALSLESRPTNAIVSLTGRCNLNCAHCGIRVGRRIPMNADDISEEIFRKLEVDLFPYVGAITLGGGNDAEQMFARRWDELFERMNQFDFELTLQTNGTLYNDERCQQLAERRGGTILRVSVDAAREETFDQVRGTSLERVWEFIRKTKGYGHAVGRNVKAFLSCTIFESNVRELTEMVEITKEIGVDRLTAHHLRPHYEFQRYQSLVYHKSLSNDEIARAEERARELGVSVDFPGPFRIPAMTVKPPDDYDANAAGGCSVKTFKCVWPWTHLVITEKGVVTPCGSSTKIMGDLTTQSFMEAWNSKPYQAFRKQVNAKVPKTDCRTCLLGRRQVGDTNMLALIGEMRGFSLNRAMRNHLRDWLMSRKNGEQWLQRARRLARRV